MKKYVVTLTDEERDELLAITSKGIHSSQKVVNALILLGCDEGEYQTNRSTNAELSRVLNISMRKIDRVKERFVTNGLDAALIRKKPDRIYDKKIDGDFEAKLIALSCSELLKGTHNGLCGCWLTKWLNFSTSIPSLMKASARF